MEMTKFEIMLKALNDAKTIIFRGNPFIFIDVSTIIIKETKYLYGKLIKYGDKEESTFDIEYKKTSSVVVPDKIIAQTHFIIEFDESLLLYTESTNHINKNSFIERFNELVYSGLSETGYEVTANPIHDNYAFYDRLIKLNKINILELKIFPTNPNPNEIIAVTLPKLVQV